MNIRKENIYDLTVCVYVLCTVVADDGSLLMKLARLFLAGIWGVKMLTEKTIKITPYLLRLAAFWAFATMTILWAEDRGFAVSMSKSLMINLVCMCALLNLMDHQRQRMDFILKTLIAAPIILEMRVILQGGLLAFLDTRTIGSISGNTVGMCAAFGACFAAYYWIQGEKCKYGILFAVNTVIVILSASKKALLFECIPLVTFFLFDRKIPKSRRLLRAFLLLMAGGTGLVLLVKTPILYDLIGNRLEGMVATLVGNAEKADGSSEARALLITRGMQWFRERPLQGYGIDCYRVVLVKNHPTWPIDAYAHNNYVELLVDTGLIGTVLYYWNYAEALRIGWKNRDSIHHTELLAMGILLALLVGEMALVSYYDKYVQVLVLTLAVLISEFPPEEKWVKPMPFPDIPMGKRYTH